MSMGLSYRKVWTFTGSVVYNIIHGIYVTIETTGKGKQLMTYQYIDDELDNRQHRHKQPLPRRDILREARKQAIAEARQTRQPPTQQRPQSIPHQSIADDLGYGDDEDWDLARMPTVTRLYDLKPSDDAYYHPQPLRRSTLAHPRPKPAQGP